MSCILTWLWLIYSVCVQSVEALCNLGQGAVVYARLAKQCEAHISERISTLAGQIERDAQEHAHMQLGSPHLASAAAAGEAAASSPVSPSTSSSSSSLSLPLLLSLQSVWSSHCQELLIIRGIFLFLDRTFVMQQANHAQPHNNLEQHNHTAVVAVRDAKKPPASLWEMGLNFFCEQMQGQINEGGVDGAGCGFPR